MPFHRTKLYSPDWERFDYAVAYYHWKYGKIPVDLESLRKTVSWVANDKRVNLIPEKLDGRAYLMDVCGVFDILYNRDLPLWEQRSDIGHEFGHILHSCQYWATGYPKLRLDRLTNEELELEEDICDEIGAGLLCPDWAITELVARAAKEVPNLTGDRLVSRLARQFQFPREELEAHLFRHFSGLTSDQVVELILRTQQVR